MALAVMGVLTSIAVTGTRWMVPPTTGRPLLPPVLLSDAPDALNTWPRNWPAGMDGCCIGLVAATPRTNTATTPEVSSNITHQKRLVALFGFI
jgi:hypothetical protein